MSIQDLSPSSAMQVPTVGSVTFLDQQLKVLEAVKYGRNLLIFHGMGSGKTLTALGIIHTLHQQNLEMNFVIAAPASLVKSEHWYKELKRFSHLIHTPAKRINVMSHATFQKMAEEGTLAKHSPFCLIIDEAHVYRLTATVAEKPKDSTNDVDDEDKTTTATLGPTKLAALKGAALAESVYLLTGTPVVNHPSDIAILYGMLIRRTDVPSVLSFFRAFKQSAKKPREHMQDDFRRWFHCLVSFHKRLDEDTAYPRFIIEDEPVPMTESEMWKYLQLFEAKDQNGVSEPQSKKGKHADTENPPNSNRNAFRHQQRQAMLVESKADWILRRIAVNLLDKKKTIVYGSYVENWIRPLQVELENMKIPFSVVTGDSGNVSEDVENYNSGQTRVMLLSKAGSEGLDLKETAEVILTTPEWNRARINQVVARAVRQNSHKSKDALVRVINLFSIFSEEFQNSQDQDIISPDTYVDETAARKQELVDHFYEALVLARIENNDECRVTRAVHTEPKSEDVKTNRRDRKGKGRAHTEAGLHHMKRKRDVDNYDNGAGAEQFAQHEEGSWRWMQQNAADEADDDAWRLKHLALHTELDDKDLEHFLSVMGYAKREWETTGNPLLEYFLKRWRFLFPGISQEEAEAILSYDVVHIL